MAQSLKIFISSPGDVEEERRRAALVIGRLKREFARFFDILAKLWEYEPMTADGHFQDVIDPPSTADIVVLILWSRLGTPLPEQTAIRQYRGRDGRAPVTGTEWEYEQALEAREQRGVPDLLVYRKVADGFAKFSRAEQLDQIRQQWEALQGFWQRHFEGSDGRFKAAFNRFTALDEFESQLEEHLRELIRRRLPPHSRTTEAKGQARIEWWSGSPYAGLKAFNVDQAPVFFGRERAERQITEALVRHAGEGAASMLVLGASGSGKSSLVRAGLLPDLMAPGVVSGISTWRYVVLQPAELTPDPFRGLAAALLQPNALPELGVVGYHAEDLAAQFRSDPALASVPLRLALQRAAAEDKNAGTSREGRLVLVLDQLEVLFTSPDLSDDTRRAIDRLFARLACSGHVWIVATLRSDFFHRFVDLPELNALAAGTGHYLLAPPNPAEIEQIITRPAEVAGLSFEEAEQGGISLAAVIREAAARDPASLPLLSFVLDELYRRDVEDQGGNILTYESYGALGGLEGAIARHAETLVEQLSPAMVAALDKLLLNLVEIDELKGTVTARSVRRSALPDSMQQELADRLIAARLLIADDIGGGQTLRLAHEALLSHWPRLAKLIEQHRDFLLVRRRLQADAAAWERHGRHPDFLLPSGRRLAEAEEVIAQRRADLDPEIIAYADASITAERERRAAEQAAKEQALRDQLARSRRIAAVVSVLLIFALAAGGIAWWQRSVAQTAQVEAETNYQLALDQAAGSAQLLTTSYGNGAISTRLMRQLMDKAQQAVRGLRNETDDLAAARAQLFDVLSLANLSLDAQAARKFAAEANALADRLLQKDAQNPRWQRLWARARGRLWDALYWTGDPQGALPHAVEAEKVNAKLAAAHPEDEDLQKDLMNDYERIGDAKRVLGDLDGADDAYRSWLRTATNALARQPDHARWLVEQGFARQRLGDTQQVRGRPVEAAVHYAEYVAIASRLEAREPDNASYLEAHSISHQRLGDAFLAQEGLARAKEEYDLHLQLANRLLTIDSAQFRWREYVAQAHQRLGDYYLRANRADSALGEFNSYLKIAEETRDRDPSRANAVYSVSNAREKLGDARRARNELDTALAEYRKAHDLAVELRNAEARNAVWQKAFALSLQRIGLTLELKGDSAAALAQYRLCVATPVNTTIWSPKTLWPADVTGYCRERVAALEAKL